MKFAYYLVLRCGIYCHCCHCEYFIFSDLLYIPLYYGVRYRRNIVRKNLVGSFPEKSQEEIIRIEKKFYHFFCDYMVETIKLFSMSKKQIMRRMTFSGVEDMKADLEKTMSILALCI